MNDHKDRRVSELSIEELRQELTRREAEDGVFADLTAIELAGEQDGERYKDALLHARVERLAPEDDKPKPCPVCGRPVPVRVKSKRRTLKTLSGKLTFVRNYHYCKPCRRGFYPRDMALGLPDKGRISSELERRVLDFALNDPFEHAAERWALHYGWTISENLVRRVTDRVGERSDACHDRHLQQSLLPAPKRRAKLMVVESDGSMVPLRGPEPWKEVKLGLIVRGDKRVLGRRARRGVISEARYVAVLGPQENFSDGLSEALRVEGALRAKTVVWLGDGAPGNWRLADRLRPGSVQVLDWHHAIEHALLCGAALLGEHDPWLAEWKRTCERLLLERGVNALVSELMDCLDETPTNAAAINDLVRYYRTNASRMRYAEYLAQGYPIATGAVESAHRHVLQVRMKRAGQRWSPHRGRRMARLRAAYRTAGPQRVHEAILRALGLSRSHPISKPKKLKASNR